jgi:hypothetical protein
MPEVPCVVTFKLISEKHVEVFDNEEDSPAAFCGEFKELY